MKKILIIGISGTGKTRCAKKVADKLYIPTIHYDTLVRGTNRTEIDEATVAKEIETIVKKDAWILEGYIHPAAKLRLEHADVVLYLDYAGRAAALGGLQRWWQYRGKKRPEMAHGCTEKLDRKFLKCMWQREERQEIEEAIKGFEAKIVRCKTRKETDRFIKNVGI